MKRTLWLFVALLALMGLLLAACGGGNQAAGNGHAAEEELETVEVPAPYKGMTNPFAGDAAAAEAGKAIYQTNCASCHGDTGQGDGPAGQALDPKPTNLAAKVPEQADDFLFWRISEGGAMEPFNSAMPAWKGVLSEEQIWQVITYLRTLGGE